MSGEVKMKRRDRTMFRAAALAAFLLIMSTVILLSVRADLDYGRNRLSRVVEYVAKRCDAYSLSSTASETRSLMRVMEAAKQAARDIRFLAGPVDEDLLRGLSVDHHLSGILLLDRDGHITASYMAGADVTALLMPELEKDALLSAADFPQKVYAARIHCPDSSYIDMAAYGRLDAAGTVVVYYNHAHSLCQKLRTGIPRPAGDLSAGAGRHHRGHGRYNGSRGQRQQSHRPAGGGYLPAAGARRTGPHRRDADRARP